jgi:hypothetical protein
MTKKHEANLLKAASRDEHHGVKRNSKWPSARKKHLKTNPTCQACGALTELEVHHMKPFHLHPTLELDPTNLITLCMENDCHLYVGHGDNFKAYNPNVLEDSAKVLAGKDKLKTVLKEVTATAKKARLFE